MIVAETPRLLISAWQSIDIAELCELTRQEGLSEFSLSGYANFSEDRARAWLKGEVERFESQKLQRFKIVLRETKNPIGISGIFRPPGSPEDQAEMNYRYPKAYRGQGFATEAGKAIIRYGLHTLGLKQINANVDGGNSQSIAVLKRLGMTYVGPVWYEGVEGSRWKISELT